MVQGSSGGPGDDPEGGIRSEVQPGELRLPRDPLLGEKRQQTAVVFVVR